MAHAAFFVVARLNFQRFVELRPQGLKLLLPLAGRRQLQRCGQLQQPGLALLLQQHGLMHGIIDQKVLFREPSAEMGPQQRQVAM